MQIIPSDTKIDFLRRGPMCAALSCAAIAISIVMWFVWGGFKLGIEFAGGTVLQFGLPQAEGIVDTGRVRNAMGAIGFPDADVVSFGDAEENVFQVSLRISEEEAALLDRASVPESGADGPGPSEEVGAADASPDPAGEAAPEESGSVVPTASAPSSAEGDEEASEPLPASAETSGASVGPGGGSFIQDVIERLEGELGTPLEVERVESIGPRIGGELTRAGFEAVFVVGLLILFYIWLRFDLRFAPGAVVALLHDVTITAGVFIVFQLEFNLQVLAALLVVLGYSLNDTIVVYDRIRENVELRGSTQLRDVVNQSVNQTLSRSLLTSLTTMLVVLALLILGGPVLRDFAVALLVGIVVGTYSSIYVASALLVSIQQRWQYEG